MNSASPKKISISLTVSQNLLNKMHQLIKGGKFSSLSDIVNVSVSIFFGKLSVYENEFEFDYNSISDWQQPDNSARETISITYSEFLDAELENLSAVTQKNKSYLVRIALSNFFEYYNNLGKSSFPSPNYIYGPMSKTEFKEMVRKIIEEIEIEKKN